MACLCIVLSLFFSCFAFTMCCSQYCYIINGVTLNEELRKKWKDGNPYDNGCWDNCCEFCCADGGPSIDERQKYFEDGEFGPNNFV